MRLFLMGLDKNWRDVTIAFFLSRGRVAQQTVHRCRRVMGDGELHFPHAWINSLAS
jgi:hypothetical protein